jgi:hypothetical protein
LYSLPSEKETRSQRLKRKIAALDVMTKLAKIAIGLLIFGAMALAFARLSYWESTLPLNVRQLHLALSARRYT